MNRRDLLCAAAVLTATVIDPQEAQACLSDEGRIRSTWNILFRGVIDFGDAELCSLAKNWYRLDMLLRRSDFPSQEERDIHAFYKAFVPPLHTLDLGSSDASVKEALTRVGVPTGDVLRDFFTELGDPGLVKRIDEIQAAPLYVGVEYRSILLTRPLTIPSISQ